MLDNMQAHNGIPQTVAEKFPGLMSVLAFFNQHYDCYVRQIVDGRPQVAVCLDSQAIPPPLGQTLRQRGLPRLPLEVEVLLHPSGHGGWQLVVSTARRYNVIYQVDKPGDLLSLEAPECQTLLTYLN